MRAPGVFLLVWGAVALASVVNIKSEDQFYSLVDNGRYSLIKYYTTWCSHCKHLAPVFAELSDRDIAAPNGAELQFLEVDCDRFSSSLCARLPGFPVIELVRPAAGDRPEEEAEPPVATSGWQRVLRKLRSLLPQKQEFRIPADRIVEFRGSRTADAITAFFQQAVRNDRLEGLAQSVFEGGRQEDDPLVRSGRAFLASIAGKDPRTEIRRLQALLGPDVGASKAEELRFHLFLAGKLQEAQSAQLDDEL
ncbi:AaceriAER039Wp [[Ashbya] aceris (nom. inval.)]|nr:AaceriAER039Wp [[Ashbya] aceris (nom. inval.)]